MNLSRIIKFLSPNNWTKLKYEVTEKSLDSKILILLSQIAVVGMLAAMAHVVYDLSKGLYEIVLLELLVFFILIAVYILNENKKHLASKLVFLIGINLSLFVIINIAPKDSGTYLLMFPILGSSFILLYNHTTLRALFSFLTFFLIVITVITDFQAFGDFLLDDTDPTFSFLLNFLISSSAFSLVINRLIRANQNSLSDLHVSLDESKESVKILRSKSEELAQTNSELDRFVYSTTHDLRAPLMSIKGLVNLIQMRNIDKDSREYLNLIEKSISRLDHFIDDIVFHSQNQRTKVTFNLFSLYDLVDEIVQAHEHSELSTSISFQYKSLSGVYIEADKYRLRVLLNNLINNAIKYHKDRESNKWVKIDFKEHERFYTFSVSDNGKGIDSSFKTKIFEMFVRGSEQSKGSGLGLFIVKETVDKLGGTIAVESTENLGSTFSFTLPKKQLLESIHKELEENLGNPSF